MPQETLANQIIAYLRQDETDYAAAAAAVGPPALPILKDIAMGNDEMLASKAVYLASMINDPAKEEVLQAAANHQSPLVRVAAAATADKLETSRAEVMLNQLVDDADVGVSKFSMRSIQKKGLSKNFRVKLKNIQDKSPNDSLKVFAKDMLKGVK